ncbi:MAG: hypothetical protein LBC90_02090 [Candidatus Adiutrix sp.]|jgi:hypothetical protein|nr:hypothetical protein [Candidatus Adiutrix sp.]
MLERICPLRADTIDGDALFCISGCAWFISYGDGDAGRCAITWLPRLTNAIEAQTKLLKDVLAAGLPGFPPEGH